MKTEYTIIRRKVKHARISVSPELVVKVVVPLRYGERELLRLIDEKESWIIKTLAHFRELGARRIALETNEILYLGKPIARPFESGNTQASLEAWYKHEAKRTISARVAVFASYYGFIYNKIIIRGSKTRWGTCSIKKNVAFNWRLIKAPADIIDYVILHELTHTVVFDHSKRFWDRLAMSYPNHKAAKQWLKDHGPGLY